MDEHVELDSLSVRLDPDSGRVSLRLGELGLTGTCWTEISAPGRRPLTWAGLRAERIERHAGLSARLATADPGITLRLEATLSEEPRSIALRLGVENNRRETAHVHRLAVLDAAVHGLGRGALDGWVNGFHSWSFSGYVRHDERQPRPTTGLITRPMAANPTTPYPRHAGLYTGEWVGALIEPEQRALVAGFSGVERQFGQVVLDGRPGRQRLTLHNTADGVPIQPGETLWGEWAVLYVVTLPHPDPLGAYAEAVTRQTAGRVLATAPPAGWSGWYQFFADVTAEDMRRNQQALSALRNRLPLELVQLDDGYQPTWGDWLEHNAKFPRGVAAWAEDVRQDGFTPGFWLSPFAVEPPARIVREHPGAILRDARGRPSSAGLTPGRRLLGLDPTHPATQDFVRQVVTTAVHEWGIPYLKLDFLYAGALPGQRHNSTRTRAQALRDGLALIREAAGDGTLLLGCGCPLGPAIGLVDVMRVSADVAPAWYPELYGVQAFLRGDYNIPSARNSIAGSLNRAWTHRRFWWLDADNLLGREDRALDAAEAQSLVAALEVTGSHLVLGDDLPALPAERLRWAASLLPRLAGDVETPDLFAERHSRLVLRRYCGAAGPHTVAALFNWADKPARLPVNRSELGLPPGEPLLVFDFWPGRARLMHADSWQTRLLPAHGAVLLGLRPIGEGPQLAGTDLHTSMGAEITRWDVQESVLRFTITLNRDAGGNVWLYAVAPVVKATCDSLPVEAIVEGNQGLVRLPVQVRGTSEVVVTFG